MNFKILSLLIAIYATQNILAMENPRATESNHKDFVIIIPNLIDLTDSIQNSHSKDADPRNNGEFSIWYKPKYSHADKFVSVEAEDVDGVLNKLVSQEDAPFKHQDNLKKLRTDIANTTLHESFIPNNGNPWIYLTCSNDNAPKLRTILENSEIISTVHIRDLTKQSYDQQYTELFDPENYGEISVWWDPKYNANYFFNTTENDIPQIIDSLTAIVRAETKRNSAQTSITQGQLKELLTILNKDTLFKKIVSFSHDCANDESWIYFTTTHKNLDKIKRLLDGETTTKIPILCGLKEIKITQNNSELTNSLKIWNITEKKYHNQYHEIAQIENKRNLNARRPIVCLVITFTVIICVVIIAASSSSSQ